MSLSIVIPTYNEKDNLEDLLKRIFASSPADTNVLIVDDNSPDGTGELADRISSSDKRIKVLHRPNKEGLGKAYLDGFRHALGASEADYIMGMDADLSHDPAYIPKLLGAMKDCDVAVGSRFCDGRISIVNWPLSRLILSYGASIYIRLFTPLSVRDNTTGYKCFRRGVVERLLAQGISSNGYAFLIEENYLCHRMGFRIKEVPIIFYDRNKGRSKMNTLKATLEAIAIVWRVKFRRIVGPENA